MREAEEQLRDAAARLGRLEGKNVEKRDIRIIIGGGDDTKSWRIERGGGSREHRPGPEPRPDVRPTVPSVPGTPGDVVRPRDDSDRRLRDLERRLDEVMRQLDRMRRDMQGPRPDDRPRERRPERDTREKLPDATPGVDRDPKRDPNLERRERSRIEIDLSRPQRK